MLRPWLALVPLLLLAPLAPGPAQAMTEDELIEYVAERNRIDSAEAEAAVAAVLDGITRALEAGERVLLPNFGTFSVVERKARQGRNPQTGETVEIPARKAVRFKPSKTLREAVEPGP